MGTPGQFDPVRYRDFQAATIGYSGEAWFFVRLPAWALPFELLAKLPYREAYLVWQGLCAAALAGFVLLWRTRSTLLLMFVLCWSFPLSSAFANGQDDAFLLLWIALAAALFRERPFAAGAILALCTMKFHLFLPIPLILIAGRRWRSLGGFAAVATVIFALCFVAAGPDWVGQYLEVILNPVTNPNPGAMPNLRGLFASLSHSVVWELCADIPVVAAIWFIAARASFPMALAAALIGGILISHHAYNADLVLLIPALDIASAASTTSLVRLLTLLLLLPVWFILPFAPIVPLLMLGVLFAVTIPAAGPVLLTARRS
jgi:hypothetical protein